MSDLPLPEPKKRDHCWKLDYCPACGKSEIEPRTMIFDERDREHFMQDIPMVIQIWKCWNKQCGFKWKIEYYDERI